MKTPHSDGRIWSAAEGVMLHYEFRVAANLTPLRSNRKHKSTINTYRNRKSIGLTALVRNDWYVHCKSIEITYFLLLYFLSID